MGRGGERRPGAYLPEARHAVETLRSLADQAFSRAAGAPLVEGNRVRLLRDARENYPAWLAAIGAARRQVHFENYIIRQDASGALFAEALIAKARQGVPVRVIYDWLGCFGTPRRFWDRLRAAGVEVRCYNPPRFESPLGWLSRDHRKMVSADGEVGFVTGLCVGRMWEGDPGRNVEPWRDTGVEIRGPAVADIDRAFAQIWAALGEPIAEPDPAGAAAACAPQGSVGVRIVATMPSTAGMLRVDQLISALARERIWLTDAYYAGTSSYVQALSAAARGGVDVRLLLPGTTDIPILRPLSRAGYRPLLEAGARIFEWNGTMLHAKTAVADGRWARVGSTNLNIASWLGNHELDAVIDDAAFGREMEEMYLQDLENATEVVLEGGRRVHARAAARLPRPALAAGAGSRRAAAGAIRLRNAIGAAFTNQRVLETTETRTMFGAALVFLALAALVGLFPRVVAYSLVAVLAWVAIALLYRAYTLHRAGKARAATSRSAPKEV